MLIKKTIVLTSDATVGYLTLIRVGNSVGVKVVLNAEPRGKLYLGLRAGAKKQINAELSGRRTELDVNLDLAPTDELGAVIVDERGKTFAYGGRKDGVNKDKILPKTDTKTADTEPPVTELEKTENSDTVGEIQSEKIENPVTVSEMQENIVPDNSANVADNDEIITENVPDKNFPPFSENKGENFYANVRSRLEEIMTTNPSETELEKLIPESKWVKVYYDEEEYYVVGILTEEGEVTFLGYGVPGIEGIKPPKEAEELCDFLPIPESVGEGYWLMFQNARNGEMVKTLA